jgi:hypothetical protein
MSGEALAPAQLPAHRVGHGLARSAAEDEPLGTDRIDEFGDRERPPRFEQGHRDEIPEIPARHHRIMGDRFHAVDPAQRV